MLALTKCPFLCIFRYRPLKSIENSGISICHRPSVIPRLDRGIRRPGLPVAIPPFSMTTPESLDGLDSRKRHGIHQEATPSWQRLSIASEFTNFHPPSEHWPRLAARPNTPHGCALAKRTPPNSSGSSRSSDSSSTVTRLHTSRKAGKSGQRINSPVQ